ncbi:GntR family transcriptional regulator [Salinibacterium sp. SWN167]|nr:GntR family transcriptional regulator [Salinibacterium sp. SWN167]
MVSVVDTVHAKLRNEILQGQQRPGSPLSVSSTAARLEVSAVPVREALRRLEGERLVKFEANVGAIVAPISFEDLRDVYETRKIVEAAAVKIAVETNAISHSRLRGVIARMSEAYIQLDHDAAYLLHREFHHLIVDIQAQPRLHAMALSLLEASDRYLRLAPGLPDEASVLVELHTAISDAILASDAQAAHDAVVRNMNYSLDRLEFRNFTHNFPSVP